MSKIFCLVLCVLCAEVALTQAASRFRRAGGSSSSSSSSGGGGGGSYSANGSGGFGGTGGGFTFPTNNFGFSGFGNAGGPPFPDFNILFQQFLASLQAAQAYAAANPHYAAMFHQQLAHLMAQQQAAMAQNPAFFYPGVDANTINPDVRTSGANNVYTGASVNYGPGGGYGQAASFPGGNDGLGVRIAEELPAPSGGSFGVFTSSSSGTSDVNGKRTSFKTSTFGTNDNGKITFRTINE